MLTKHYQVYVRIIFSEKVESREELIEIMMDKLSKDDRVDEWYYVSPKQNYIRSDYITNDPTND